MNNGVEKYVLFMKNLEKFICCMNSKWEKIIKRYGLTLSSYHFFDYICNNQGVTQQEMACLFKVDKAILSRACRQLESEKLIERRVNNNYSHGYGCYLTEKGSDFYLEIQKEGKEGFERIFCDVDVADLERVGDIISMLYEKIENMES